MMHLPTAHSGRFRMTPSVAPDVPPAPVLVVAICLTAISAAGVATGAWPLLLPLAVVVVVALVRLGPAAALAFGLLTMPLGSYPVIPALRINLQDLTVALIAVTMLDGVVHRRWPDRLRPCATDVVVALLFGWIGLSLLATGSLPGDLRFFERLSAFPAAMYVGGRWAFSGERRARWLLAVGASACIVTALLWVEYVVGEPIFWRSGKYLWDDQGFRAGGMLNGPNFASAYVAIGLAATVALAGLNDRVGRAAALMAIVLPTSLLATKSASGTLVMSAVVVACLLARGSRVPRLLVWLGVVVAISPPVRAAILDLPWFASHALSLEGRFDLLETARVAAVYFSRDPLWMVIGAGYNTEMQIGARFGVGTVFRFEIQQQGESLHNAFLALTFESGVPAALAYLGLLLGSLRSAWRHRAEASRLAGGLVGILLLVFSASNTVTAIPQVFGFAMFVLAAAVTSPAPRQASPDDSSDGALARGVRSPGAAS